MRTFNIACNVIFFISIAFTFPFFGFLDVPQIVFYLIFVLVGLANIAFLVVGVETRVAWVRNRSFTVMLPVLVMISLQITSMFFFLKQLDEMHDKLNNTFPVPEKDQLLVQSFVVNNLLLFYMIPLFMGVSYFAYALDLGRQLDSQKIDAHQLLV